MDWKREAVEKLRCYEPKKNGLVRATEELERLESEITRICNATSDSTLVVGGSGNYEDILINNISHREELKLAIREARRWVSIVESGLAALNVKEKKILDRFYINPAKGNVECLCEELRLEKSRIYKLKDEALRHFTIALYGVTET